MNGTSHWRFVLPIAATALAIAFAMLVVLVSESGMFLAMGSDLGATSYSPALGLKLLALTMFAVAVAWSAFARPRSSALSVRLMD